MAAKICASRKAGIIMALISIILFIASVIILILFPVLYKMLLYRLLPLVSNSMTFTLWRDLPIPLTEKIYFFNITNKEEFLSGTEKLKVTQVGPYAYEASWKKHNVQWHPNKTVTYQELRTYHFSPSDSAGTEDDVIHTFNGPLIIASDFLKDQSDYIKLLASLFFKYEGEEIIMEKTVRELVYEGYYDPIINDASYVISGLPYKDGIFSWLYGKNATYDGQFTVFTGESDIKKLNVINNWNGNEKLPYWKNDSCNMINGSSLEMNPPLDEDQQELSFFQSFFCRTLTLDYNGTNPVHYGLDTKRFYATQKILQNGKDNPNNECFDIKPNLRSGILDLSPCQFGAPAFVSFPHFFMADPSYADAVIGLDSKNEDFRSYADVEPQTGATVYLKLAFQVNLELIKIPHLWQFSNVPEGFFPVFWAQLEVGMPKDLGDMMRNHLQVPKIAVYSVLGILLLVSIIMFMTSIIILFKAARPSGEFSDRTPIVNPNDYNNEYKSVEKSTNSSCNKL